MPLNRWMQVTARSIVSAGIRPFRRVSLPSLTTSRSRLSTANESGAAASTTASFIEFEPMSIAASFTQHPSGLILVVTLGSSCYSIVKLSEAESDLYPASRQIELEGRHPSRFRASTQSSWTASSRNTRALLPGKRDRPRSYFGLAGIQGPRDHRNHYQDSKMADRTSLR